MKSRKNHLLSLIAISLILYALSKTAQEKKEIEKKVEKVEMPKIAGVSSGKPEEPVRQSIVVGGDVG